MKKRNRILAGACVLLLAAAGFFLPRATSLLTDAGLSDNTINVEDPQESSRRESTENIWEAMEDADILKEYMKLRQGEKLNETSAQEKAGDALAGLQEAGLAEGVDGGEWLVTPVLVYAKDDRDKTGVRWECVWYSGNQYETRKIGIVIDDETGYMLSFILYPSSEGSETGPADIPGRMTYFLENYYPSEGRTDFVCTERAEGRELDFSTEDGQGNVYGFRFHIMQDGKLVFNM